MSTVFVDLIKVEPLTFDEYVTRYPSRALDARGRYSRYLERFQPFRWVAKNADNQKKMARSPDRYYNRKDCIDAIEELSATATVFLREAEQGNRLLRRGRAVEQ